MSTDPDATVVLHTHVAKRRLPDHGREIRRWTTRDLRDAVPAAVVLPAPSVGYRVRTAVLAAVGLLLSVGSVLVAAVGGLM